MKRKVKLPQFAGESISATIIVDKNGMRIEDKSEYCNDSYVCERFIVSLLDMDSWNHSWHINVSSAVYKRSEERKKIRQILKDKISQREEEIKALKDGIQVLGRWNYKIN